MARYRITVNGSRRDVDAAPDTPLLWVLRDTLALTGTKYGCGVGACGSCLVLRGGAAVASCRLTIAEAAGQSFVTIEGLSPDGGHPVQRAWIEEDVAQCGYCQPAMILRTVALLGEHADPSDAQIDAALGELVCRCGTSPRLRRAVTRAAAAARAR
jgi:isoquinoline 1-oxidoreductase alpha subunit